MNDHGAPGGTVLAWRQLLRLGNVFTASSNVIAGFLLATGEWQPAGVLAALVAASASLYAAGMVLNDAFDAELDARERPERPIPSGRIRRSTALRVGWLFLAGGVALSYVAAAASGQFAPFVVAGCLALTIVMYDGGLKRTAAGPAAMGWCRTLNVLLGASAAANLADQWDAWFYAAGVGAYTVVLTVLARRETGGSVEQSFRTRALVTKMILGFIVLDACAATVAAGWLSGVAVLALLIPSLLAARRAPMT
jgi:4-hydroxybenzoate polyprenyltransferase